MNRKRAEIRSKSLITLTLLLYIECKNIYEEILDIVDN